MGKVHGSLARAGKVRIFTMHRVRAVARSRGEGGRRPGGVGSFVVDSRGKSPKGVD